MHSPLHQQALCPVARRIWRVFRRDSALSDRLLAPFRLLWAVLSGRLLQSRGAIIPALTASGLSTGAVRRAWAALAYGAWEVGPLLVKFQDLVRQEGRWQRQRVEGLRPLAGDQVGFFGRR